MHKYQIERVRKICEDELAMREHVFRKDYIKRQRKTKEMKYVIDVLNQCEKEIADEQGTLFPSEMGL